ncbi:AzlD domain-containing protein [Selenihalanaerobacter shriftii]|uniref:Branched-chain amino acid transport protein n=1 Tax=Selenihalanaerobacter shriftii TaxID=142842 RepID=A0A1T4PSW2_9FIRM|nr:AzlD domain-containing protein [Selenihalanaerobacter shriftii]SJZ94642.1 Branched-chain amino acid transport protein [Selenihalanaerobacter shriftii]
MENLIVLIIGMAVVTYVPRMLPIVLLQDMELPNSLRRFLEFIPFAAIGALIFPGILSSTGSKESAIIGGIVAISLAIFEINLLLIVVSSIFGVFFWEITF